MDRIFKGTDFGIIPGTDIAPACKTGDIYCLFDVRRSIRGFSSSVAAIPFWKMWRSISITGWRRKTDA